MITFPADVLVCGELINLQVRVPDEELKGYEAVGLVIDSVSYKSNSSSTSSLSSSTGSMCSGTSSMQRLKSVESLSSVTLPVERNDLLNTQRSLRSPLTNALRSPLTNQTLLSSPSNSSTKSSPNISPSTSFSSVMAANLINSITTSNNIDSITSSITTHPTNTHPTNTHPTTHPLQLSFRIDPDAVNETPGASSTLHLQLSLTGRRPDHRVERIRSLQGSVQVIRALGMEWMRRGALLQLKLRSGQRGVTVKRVQVRGYRQLGEAKGLCLEGDSTVGLVFEGSRGEIGVEVEAEIDDRLVSLSFESGEREGEEEVESPVQFTFKRLVNDNDKDKDNDSITLQFQLLAPSGNHLVLVHYARSNSIVPVASSTRHLAVLPCGVVQWRERFQVIGGQDALELGVKIVENAGSSSGSNDEFIERVLLERRIYL